MSIINLYKNCDIEAFREVIKVDIKKLFKGVELPTYSTDGSAGCDIRVYPELESSNPEDPNAPKEITIEPGETYYCHTGFATKFSHNIVALIYNRSGLSTKEGLCLPAGVYVIDSDYRGEWRVPIKNTSNSKKVLKSGDRIAQVLWHYTPRASLNEVDELPKSKRGTSGFGSTGLK